MGFNKTVLTTGEVAKICKVAPRTVSKWFDSGHLRGYRIPGSKDRRIPLDHLLRFMRAHGIPLDGLDTGRTRLLLLDRDRSLCETIRNTLTTNDQYEVECAGSAFEAGVIAQEFKPHTLLVDVTLPDVSPRAMSLTLRSKTDLQATRLIGIAANLDNGSGESLLQVGFDAYLCKPFDIPSLIDLLKETPTPTA